MIAVYNIKEIKEIQHNTNPKKITVEIGEVPVRKIELVLDDDNQIIAMHVDYIVPGEEEVNNNAR